MREANESWAHADRHGHDAAMDAAAESMTVAALTDMLLQQFDADQDQQLDRRELAALARERLADAVSKVEERGASHSWVKRARASLEGGGSGWGNRMVESAVDDMLARYDDNRCVPCECMGGHTCH